MRIVVTGCAGFIGSHLVPALTEAGHDVRGIVEPGVATGSSDVSLRTVDIRTGDGLAASFAGADAVIHLAARNHVLKETSRDPLAEYHRANVEGTRNVIRAAAGSGAKLFVHLSSVKAMGEESDKVLDENDRCLPETPYGISKLESEKVVRAEAARAGMRAVILRLPMAYGPRNKGNLPRMIRWAARGLPFPLFRPENLRSMVYVGNVVAGIMAVLKNPPAGMPTYILKDRDDCSSRAVYSAICRELGKSPRFLPIPAFGVRLGGMFSADVRKVTGSFRVSSGKIEREIGFLPPVSFEEGISRTVRWCRDSAR